MRLILASTSPRRKDILALLGMPFDIIPPDLEEVYDSSRSTSEEAGYWALRKAQVVFSQHPEAIVIGSDTLIEFNEEKIGKPLTSEEALNILRKLSGQEHFVVTAIGMVSPKGSERTAIEKVHIRMKKVCDEVLKQYAHTDEPLDKAGAYSLQGEGRFLIEALEGDYLAAVGLPLRLVARFLTDEKLSVPKDVEEIYRKREFPNWKSFGE